MQTQHARLRQAMTSPRLTLAGLSEALAATPGRMPPVETWEPPYCGDLPIRIHADGGWSYMGSAIARPAMVRLFASVLRRDADGRHYLVTPVEKIGIQVDTTPFVAIAMERRGDTLRFATNLGDSCDAGVSNPIALYPQADGGFAPMVRVRANLDARLSRACAYALADCVETRAHAGGMWHGVASGGAFFPLEAAQ